MSDERRADAEPFLAWWSVLLFASSRLSLPISTSSQLRNSDPATIFAGASCVRTCSRVKKPAGGNFVSAKILLLIWPRWKLNFSCEVCRSAFFCLQLSMRSSDHASGALSREAKRLDGVTWHDRLLHAHVKASSYPFAPPFLLLSLISLPKGLDRESLSSYALSQPLARDTIPEYGGLTELRLSGIILSQRINWKKASDA